MNSIQIERNIKKAEISLQLHLKKIKELGDKIEELKIKKYTLYYSKIKFNHDYFAMVLSSLNAVAIGLHYEDKSLEFDTRYKIRAVINVIAQHNSKSVEGKK